MRQGRPAGGQAGRHALAPYSNLIWRYAATEQRPTNRPIKGMAGPSSNHLSWHPVLHLSPISAPSSSTLDTAVAVAVAVAASPASTLR